MQGGSPGAGEPRGKLRRAHVMVAATGLECAVEHVHQREVRPIGMRDKETAPGAQPVGADAAGARLVLEGVEEPDQGAAEVVGKIGRAHV